MHTSISKNLCVNCVCIVGLVRFTIDSNSLTSLHKQMELFAFRDLVDRDKDILLVILSIISNYVGHIWLRLP